MVMHVILYISVLVVVVNSEVLHSAYEGHQIWKIRGHLELMRERFQYLKDHNELDILGHDGKVRVKKEQLENVRNDLHNHGLEYDIIVPDLQQHLQDKDTVHRHRRQAQNENCISEQCSPVLLDKWLSFKEIESYLSYINKTYSSYVKVSSIEKTFEGRDIWLVHIAPKNNNNEDSANNIFIEAGIHAREWLSYNTALHFIDKLVHSIDSFPHLRFYIVPVANPDGYEFSRTKQRFWRKNRRINENTACVGVDLNRNWDYKFGIGASMNPCAEDYMGTAPFTEPEVRGMSNVMKNIPNLILVLSLHTYGRTLLYPWGWTVKSAPDTEAMKELGNVFKKSIDEYNDSKYTVALTISGMYPVSGCTQDWAKGVLNVTYTYTLELPDDIDFVIPENKIAKYLDEAWVGCRAMFNYLN